MGRIAGGVLIIIGLVLWYYGGSNGITGVVNLGIGSIILGLVVAALPLGNHVDKATLPMVCSSYPPLLEKITNDVGISGRPVFIPPYENLPKGGIFLPVSEDFSLHLGMLDEKVVFVDGIGGGGLLLSPPPGWKIVEYTVKNVGDITGVGLGYASSAVSSTLSSLGLGSAEAFEIDDGGIEVFVKPLCYQSPYADPVVSAVLMAIAMGMKELLLVSSFERRGEYLRIVLEPMGGVEKWL